MKARSLQVFSRQFATMIDAGLSVVQSLVILEQQTDDKALAVVIRDVRSDVEGGMLLSQAMGRHPERLRSSLRLHGRSGRGSRNPRHGSRSGRRADREGDEDQATREGRDGVPDRRPRVRRARPDRDASVPRPDLPEDLRRSRWRPPVPDEDRRGRLRPRAWLLVHPLPAHGRHGVRVPALEEDPGWPPDLGSIQAAGTRGNRQGRA